MSWRTCFISIVLSMMVFIQTVIAQEKQLYSKYKEQESVAVANQPPQSPPKIDRLDIKASFIVCMISDGNDG
ncbi:MAG: hypothetical protein LBG58_07800, partial [Planctomycetaceae bacterium]|nr:hypothetical protein [Planctomycetaceae bacterium]